MKYVSIYPWDVINNIKKGRKVYVLDRQVKKVYTVNDATVGDVVAVIASKEEDRYEFWYEEEVKTDETV